MSAGVDRVRALIRDHVEAPLDASLRAEAAERVKRQFSVSAWNVGDCPRKNWLLLNGAKQEPLQPRSLLVFEAGDATEDWVIDRLERASVPLVRSNEKRDTFDLSPIGRMRPDLFLDAGGEHIVADVKSMSNGAYERALKGDVSFQYKAQLMCYMRGLRVQFGVLICVRKETSEICYVVIEYSDAQWQEVLRYHAEATGLELPRRRDEYALTSECKGVREGKCFGGKTPTGKKDHTRCGGTGLEPGGPFIPNYPCGYCSVKDACWGGLSMVLDRDGAPRWRPNGGA